MAAQKPLVVVAIGFGARTAVHVLILFGAESMELYTMAYMILLPYSLFRWGAGHEAVIGLAIILAAVAISGFIDESVVAAMIGSTILLFSRPRSAFQSDTRRACGSRDRSSQAPRA